VNLAIFDIDGTLTRPYSCEDAAFLRGLELAFGFRDVDSDWNSYPHVTDTGIVSHVCEARWGRPPTSTEMSLFRSHYSNEFNTLAQPDDGVEVPGAAAFFVSLRNAPGWCVAIATGNYHRMALLKLTRGEIPHLDVPMATADDSVSRAELVRLAATRARSHYRVPEFGHIVSIGDAPWDLKTARELDIPFLAVGARCGDPSTGARAVPDYRDAPSVLRAFGDAVPW
jgi:phosphoglycolate phosphatase-like HAD superfamily hydrolase